MQNKEQDNSDISTCSHKNVKREGGFFVCQDCGLTFDDDIDFEKKSSFNNFSKDSQRDYEIKISKYDRKAKQDPKIKYKYDKIRTLEKWFRDYQTSFSHQKKTLDLLKSSGIGLSIDSVKFREIKERYLRYNKKHRKTYQNMVIIFLAIVWIEIKDITKCRIEEFIKAAEELGHKINKKMLNNAMEKVQRTEEKWKKYTTTDEIEYKIKKKIKILFQKDLNSIPYEKVQDIIPSTLDSEYEKLKIEMQLLADKFLKKIPQGKLHNLNYKAFTAGLIYYIGQTLHKENRKIFTQSLLEEITKFSSTTIRKKYKLLKEILGDPKE